ncbi:hypothetical protein ACOSQ4_018928 [Xanthoceras sorbifolium]
MATLPLLSFHIIQAEVWSVAPETLPVTLFPPCNLYATADGVMTLHEKDIYGS